MPDFTERLHINTENNGEDIKAYILAETEVIFRDIELREEIQKNLISRSKGMFLWAKLVLEELKNLGTTQPRAVRKKLLSLPTRLYALYGSMLQRIPSDLTEDVAAALQWIVWAPNPLTLPELAVAIAIRSGQSSHKSLREDMQTDMEKFLRATFGPLLHLAHRAEVQSGPLTFKLVHQSTKDFLVGGKPPSSIFNYSERIHPVHDHAHLCMAISCLIFIAFEEFSIDSTPSVKARRNSYPTPLYLAQKYPFCDVAALNWSLFAAKSQSVAENSLELVNTYANLVAPERWNNLRNASYFNNNGSYGANVLQITASFGVTSLVRYVVGLGYDNNDIDTTADDASTALQCAIVKGHIAVVRFFDREQLPRSIGK